MHERREPGTFRVSAEVKIRACREEDLGDLEWFGKFTPHREIIRGTFEEQRRGRALMLIAEMNRFPAGQAWIDLARPERERTGVIWAVRVLPPLRGTGIGTRLIAAAELALRDRGLRWAELTVEKDNPEARRLYERLGYHDAGDAGGEYGYTTPNGVPVRVPMDQWRMRKRLRKEGARSEAADPVGRSAHAGEPAGRRAVDHR